jgi:hypothetical protein
MIDRDARNKMAVLVRRLVACRITNDDFEGGVPSSDDPAIHAVHGMAWRLYEDLETHRLEGRFRVPKKYRREIARWILFLYSNDEYAWPDYSLFQIHNWPMNLLTFGWWEKRKERRLNQFKGAGDFEMWPFISRSSFERALNRDSALENSSRLAQSDN